MIALILIGVAVLWVGSAWGLIAWFGRARGKTVRRGVSRRIIGHGEPVAVTVTTIPPFTAEAVDDHDVVLLLDHSGSMGAAPGSALWEMIRAAGAFIRRLPDPVRVAVVSFDDTATCLCSFTAEKRRAVHAVSGIQPGGGTRIGAALARAAELLDTARPNVHCTVVLFSDGFDAIEEVRKQAESLRGHASRPAVYCASFGGDETVPLMAAVAGEPQRIFLTARFDGLFDLFAALAAEVSGQRAVAGLLSETIGVPRPFTLDDTGGSTPVDIQTGASTIVSWPLPQFDGNPTPTHYTLRGHCLGWHKVVNERGRVMWRMPDGGVITTDGPSANRVMVLPSWLVWARPLDLIVAVTIAHPLILLLLGRFLHCPGPAVIHEQEPMFPDRDATPLPEVPVLAPPSFRPPVRAAVVIGLGRDGAAVLSGLREWLRERQIDPALVSTLAVRIGPDRNRRDDAAAGDQLLLSADLWPWVTALRDSPLPDDLGWLPIDRWLDHGQPLTSLRGAEGDRAKARAIGLFNRDRLRRAIVDRLVGRSRQEVQVFVTGAADDDEATGLLADVAHIAATEGHGVNAVVLAPDAGSPERPGIAAFAREMNRLLARRDDPVVVEAEGQRFVARHLFDQLFVAGQPLDRRERRIDAAVAHVWSLLSSAAVTDRLLPRDPGLSWRVDVSAYRLPQDVLWRWVREMTLEAAILRRWLCLTGPIDALVPPPPDTERVNRLIDDFWTNTNAPATLRLVGDIVLGREVVGALLYGSGTLPADRPEHEQKAYCDRERRQLGRYLEAWCAAAIAEAEERGCFPISELKAAATSIQASLVDLHGKLQPYADQPDSASFASLGAALLLEMRAAVSRLAASLASWEAVFLSPGMKAPAPLAIAAALGEAERGLAPWPRWREAVEPHLTGWFDRQIPNLLGNFRFQAVWRAAEQSVSLTATLGGRPLTPRDDIAEALRTLLAPHAAEVLAWPDPSWHAWDARNVHGWMATGASAAAVFGSVVDVVDDADPAYSIAVAGEAVSATNLFGDLGSAGTDFFVWPEEANADRMASMIRGWLNREPEPFSPLVVNLLREPAALHAVLVEMALEQLVPEAGALVLTREGRRYPLALLTGPNVGLAEFEAALDQALLLSTALDGSPLPPTDLDGVLPPDWDGDALVAALEDSVLGQALRTLPGWRPWRDVAVGLSLVRYARDMINA